MIKFWSTGIPSSCKVSFQSVGKKKIAMLGHRFLLSQVKNFALSFAELHEALVSPFLQPAQVL